MLTFLRRASLGITIALAVLGLFLGGFVHGELGSVATQAATILFGLVAPTLLVMIVLFAAVAIFLLWKNGGKKLLAVVAVLALAASSLLAVDLSIYASSITSKGGSYNFLTVATGGAMRAVDPVEEVVYANRDGKDLTVSVYDTGKRKKDALAPVYVYNHGGSWTSGTPRDMGMLHTAMADEGYVSFSISYRLATQGRLDNPTWDKAIVDVADAMRWVRDNAERYGGDPDRIVLSGESAGGNLALIYSGKVSVGDIDGPTPKAVGVMFPAVDIPWIKDNGRYLTPETIPYIVEPYIGGELADHPDRVAAISPLNFMHENLPQTLIIHGEKDALVTVGGSRDYVAKAKDLGVQAELVEIPFSHHGTDAQANRSLILNMLDGIEGMRP
ncbi:MAG: alpha/beta hydrolase [Propionibacteriaceae bacterium]|nr:alpha/beta hydrolase [Propionibacteriaceae bacterium]